MRSFEILVSAIFDNLRTSSTITNRERKREKVAWRWHNAFSLHADTNKNNLNLYFELQKRPKQLLLVFLENKEQVEERKM